ncbi:MAG: hypothetical protein EBQ70_13960 [Betaproteobacteria bacterium]|nr:hypothetical protein [Betaproteobacteria bacterium]
MDISCKQVTWILKSSANRTGKVSLKNKDKQLITYTTNFKSSFQKLKKSSYLKCSAFFSQFISPARCVSVGQMNGSRTCADFLARISVQNTWVFLTVVCINFSREGA